MNVTVKKIKSNIEAYHEATGLFSPNEYLIIGDDKELDIEIPSKLGFNTIYVNPYGDIKTVEEITPDIIVNRKK